MAVKCPVCGEVSEENIIVCAACGFADLDRVFLSQEDYKEWLEHTVKPFSEEYWKQRDKRQEIVDSRNSSESDVKDRENIMPIACDHDRIVGVKKDEKVVATEINADIKYKYCIGQGDINVQNKLENSCSNNKILFFDCAITDKDGIHARPAGMLVKEARKYKSRIIIKKEGKVADAKKLMTIMSLGVKCGETVEVVISGIDEDMAYEAMRKAFYKYCTGQGGINIQNEKEDAASVAIEERSGSSLRKDGAEVVTRDNEYDQCRVENWEDIVSVVCGWHHLVGLRRDGTVVAVGDNECGQCEVESWKDIVSIACGSYRTVGLRKDGTVMAVGDNKCGQCEVGNWESIVSIASGSGHTVGLRKDGTVVAAGFNKYSQCEVGSWDGIVFIACNHNCTVGLRKDGTVVAAGDNAWIHGVEVWEDVVRIVLAGDKVVGLRRNSTVMAVGYNEYGQCEVGDWKDIVSIACRSYYTVGLRKNGTVVAVGDNKYGQCEVKDWEDIVSIDCGDDHTVGLRKDHTVVAVGYNEYGQCEVRDWKDIVFIACRWNYTVGLRKDGTVVVAGKIGGKSESIVQDRRCMHFKRGVFGRRIKENWNSRGN